MLIGNKNWTFLKCYFFYISDEYAHWILVNVELSNSKVTKSWKTLSNEKTVTNMKIITVKCKKNEDNNNIKVQIWNDVTGKYETFKYQNLICLFICLCWSLTSQSTIFQSYQDGATASWVINQYFRGVKCLAQGHNTAAVCLEPTTPRSGVRHSTTEPPRSPSKFETDFQCNLEKYFCQTRSEKENELKIYRGSYTSGNFIWNLWNKPSTTSVSFCLSYVCFKWDFIA